MIARMLLVWLLVLMTLGNPGKPAPYMSGRQRVLGAIGVIGPARLNYARVIPLVDYTARVLGRMLDGNET